MTAKEEILACVYKMPEDASFTRIAEEVQTLAEKRKEIAPETGDVFGETPAERAETIAAIKEGQADIAAGRFRTHEEVKKLVRSW
jgi:predicted transcriptional regulator